MNVTLRIPDRYQITTATVNQESVIVRAIRESDGAIIAYPPDTYAAIAEVIHADKSLSVEHKDALCELMLRAYKIFRRVEL